MKKDIRALYENRGDAFYEWREAVEEIGIDATLDALGYPKDRDLLWYNEHTGSTDTLDNLIRYGFGSEYVTDDEQTYHFAMVLEHWLPQRGDSNPVIDECRAMSDGDALQEVSRYLTYKLQHSKTLDEFVHDAHNGGGSTEHGWADAAKGKARLRLHDGREFFFPLREIWNGAKTQEAQLALGI